MYSDEVRGRSGARVMFGNDISAWAISVACSSYIGQSESLYTWDGQQDSSHALFCVVFYRRILLTKKEYRYEKKLCDATHGSHGQTPQNITGLIIGEHSITIEKDGYSSKTQPFDIMEGQTTKLRVTLERQ